MEITSLQNERVKYWNNLKDKKFRDQERKFIIEGDHLINEAKRFGCSLEIISCNNKDADYYVTESIMQKISDQKSISNNIAVVEFLEEKPISGNILILDGLQDPGNLGTIIRSSVAFNISSIILSNTSVDLYNPKVIRATEGMIFHTNVLRRDLLKYIPELKSKGYKIIGTDVNKGINITKVEKNNIAIVIGSEGNGITNEVKELCDSFININMNNKCESLNAGVAASIIMYEINN